MNVRRTARHTARLVLTTAALAPVALLVGAGAVSADDGTPVIDWSGIDIVDVDLADADLPGEPTDTTGPTVPPIVVLPPEIYVPDFDLPIDTIAPPDTAAPVVDPAADPGDLPVGPADEPVDRTPEITTTTDTTTTDTTTTDTTPTDTTATDDRTGTPPTIAETGGELPRTGSDRTALLLGAALVAAGAGLGLTLVTRRHRMI